MFSFVFLAKFQWPRPVYQLPPDTTPGCMCDTEANWGHPAAHGVTSDVRCQLGSQKCPFSRSRLDHASFLCILIHQCSPWGDLQALSLTPKPWASPSTTWYLLRSFTMMPVIFNTQPFSAGNILHRYLWQSSDGRDGSDPFSLPVLLDF